VFALFITRLVFYFHFYASIPLKYLILPFSIPFKSIFSILNKILILKLAVLQKAILGSLLFIYFLTRLLAFTNIHALKIIKLVLVTKIESPGRFLD